MKTKNNRYYIIREKSTGLIKTAGINNEFNEVGKMWPGGRVKAHLRLYGMHRGVPLVDRIGTNWEVDDLSNYEVVELDMVEIQTQDLEDFIREEMYA